MEALDALDDGGRIVDAHHHLWLVDDARRPKLAVPGGERDYVVSHYLKDYEDAGLLLECSVYLECGWLEGGPVGQANETKWVAENATVPTAGRVCRAIVGHVNLMRSAEDVDACLAAHKAASPAFRGLRYTVTNDPSGAHSSGHRDANPFLNERLLRAMPVLEKHGASFELWCYGHQISEAAKFAARFPGIPMVLDHFGGPLDIAKDPDGSKFRAWADAIDLLAANKNVHAKLSGLMASLGLDYHLRPGGAASVTRWEIADGVFGGMIAHAVGAFGVDRCMWASNFPVDGGQARLGEIVRANMIVLRRMGVGKEDRKKILRTNALRFYRIGDSADLKL
ncbi:hypothetical protein DFJ74DRAFT_685783 [Hyaloraphidium curvatum]|nr:hypothetical protein DFJ74DRAFT_685783 [Hyaloraphidium curvatum]